MDLAVEFVPLERGHTFPICDESMDVWGMNHWGQYNLNTFQCVLAIGHMLDPQLAHSASNYCNSWYKKKLKYFTILVFFLEITFLQLQLVRGLLFNNGY